MASTNATIAAIFDQIADLLELQEANAFRVRAYRYAAQSIGDFGSDIRDYVARGNPLGDIPGIGEDLAKKIEEILTTGSCRFLTELEQKFPPGITTLLRIPGLGPRRVRTLWHALDVISAEQLRDAAKAQRIRALPGFGEKTEQKILESVERALASAAPRFLLAHAEDIVEPLAAALRRVEGVKAVEVTGSYRRRRESVGDLDIVVATDAPESVMAAFTRLARVREIVSSGPTRTSVLLDAGIQVDLRAVPPASFGAACQYFTGSKAHNIAVRRIAQDLDLKINEYGVHRGERCIAGRTEKQVYEAIGLSWIPPELREDRGEIQAAREGTLPALVAAKDIRGDLHVAAPADPRMLAGVVSEAAKGGLRYLAIALPSARLRAAPGALAAFLAALADVNDAQSDVTCLSAVEVGITRDGGLDVPDEVLAAVEIVIAAVDEDFDLPAARQTERVESALRHPKLNLLAHPTGRLIGEREALEFDALRIVRAAAAHRVALEVNGQPKRLDLPDILCRLACEHQAALALSAGALTPGELRQLHYALGQARRGWAMKGDVLNTRTLSQMRKALRKP